jgi:DNA anti-recombination protein RmuC
MKLPWNGLSMPSKKNVVAQHRRKIQLKKSPAVAKLRSEASEGKRAAAPPPKTEETMVMPVADESLEKVRDILFGAQAREFERRFALLEEDLLRKTAEARAEAHQRLEAIEAQLRQDVEQLTDQIKAEHQERAQTIAALGGELQSLTRALDEKINQLEAQSSQEQGALRRQLLEEAKSLATQMLHQSEELTTSLNREVQTLTHDKLNRADLAQMFTEMAQRFLREPEP